MFRTRLVAELATAALVSTLIALAPASPTTVAAAESSHQVNTADRTAVERAFLDRFAEPLATPQGWSTTGAECDPGTIPADNQAAALEAVNYARALTGLDPVTFDPALSAKAQQAALMMMRNDAMNHYPDSTWTCYTEDGAWAASHANLARSFPAPNVGDWIEMYLRDSGTNNTEAGHRKWILTPGTTVMGFGSVTTANALVVTGSPTNPAATTPAWVSWPTPGFFPSALEPAGRWSLNATDRAVDLSRATVTVTGPSGATMTTRVENAYAQNLVWHVDGLPEVVAGADQRYTVTVSGILRNGAPAANRTWSTTLFRPQGVFTWSSDPTITGQPLAGNTLTAHAGTYSPVSPDPDDAGNHIYEWLRDGHVVDYGSSTYDLTTDDVGHRISVRVSPAYGEFYSGSRTSGATDAVQLQPAPVTTAKPTIQGTAAVGERLKVTAGTWSPGYDWLEYQWLRDGAPIRGADWRAYDVTSADRGHRLSVRLTAYSFNREPATVVTAPTATIGLKPAPQAVVRPVITGKKRVGRVLEVSRGEWRPAYDRLRFKWLRDGDRIEGASGRRYRLVRADRGHRVSVRVIAIKAGHYNGRTTTEPTRRIRRRR